MDKELIIVMKTNPVWIKTKAVLSIDGDLVDLYVPLEIWKDLVTTLGNNRLEVVIRGFPENPRLVDEAFEKQNNREE